MRERERALVRLSAALGRGDRAALVEAMQEARAVTDALAVEEALLQSYLFVGYPGALQALSLWRELEPRAAAAPAEASAAEWAARGEVVCRTVYGGQYERLRANITRLHPDVERWMVHEGYGKVLARPGLELVARELCIIALLAQQDAPAQLYSHLRGALNAGASPELVEEALALALRAGDAARVQSARMIWMDVQERWLARSGRAERAE